MIQVKKILHRDEYRIAIYFKLDAELTKKAKLANASWSRTHKCWHVPYNKESYNLLQRLFPEIEVIFRRTTVVDAPGAPLVETTFKPETRPCKAVTKLLLPDSVMSEGLTVCADEPTDFARRFIPNSAVIITSSSWADCVLRMMSSEVDSPTTTFLAS